MPGCRAGPRPVGVGTGRMSKALSRLVTGSREEACQDRDCDPGAWRGIQVMSLQPATPKEKRCHKDHSCDTWQQNGQGPEHVAGRQRVTGTWRKQQQPHFHPPAVHQPIGGVGSTNHAPHFQVPIIRLAVCELAASPCLLVAS